jgi:DNA-directed RNA polymerase subunit H (RpoH/RPB5)
MKNLYRIKSVRCNNWFIEATTMSDAVIQFEHAHAGDPIIEVIRTSKVSALEVF